jgi:hypothetical protein
MDTFVDNTDYLEVCNHWSYHYDKKLSLALFC